ncbi:MAG: hypothetical protein N2C14_34185, partial [Planctomycetales bacterium]
MSNRYAIFLPCLLVLLGSGTASSAEPAVSFRRDVAPLLHRRCQGCHGEKKTESAYALHTFQLLTTPGDFDEPPIVPGKPEQSVL